MNYYNGLLFRGYVEGIPTGVLSGGQYDELIEKMGKKAGAIGFAIYLDLLEDYESSSENYDIDALLLYDDTSEPGDVMDAVRHLTEQGFKVRCQRKNPDKLRYRLLFRIDKGILKEV